MKSFNFSPHDCCSISLKCWVISVKCWDISLKCWYISMKCQYSWHRVSPQFIVIVETSWWPLQYHIRRIIEGSPELSKPQHFTPSHFGIWQAFWQQFCRDPCQISEWTDHRILRLRSFVRFYDKTAIEYRSILFQLTSHVGVQSSGLARLLWMKREPCFRGKHSLFNNGTTR